ncbi:hypothetical protein NDU88_000860 [Pleurodeles waltl]|uniref:Uncharacterized protein n=1 Tax=Pleurodeles waltl TaxID=8319 RepID=A0AAV7KN38_PLEWA|nr:hypothetical protein NDU88_000860 [Pleurodeles waltl]
MSFRLDPVWLPQRHAAMGRDRAPEAPSKPKLTNSHPVERLSNKMRSDAQTPQGPTGTQILAAIETPSANIQAKINSTAIDANLLRTDLCKVSERPRATEQQVDQMQEELTSHRAARTTLMAQGQKLEARAEDAEDHSRRCNLRFVGFPERAKGSTPELFVERWVRGNIPETTLPWCSL